MEHCNRFINAVHRRMIIVGAIEHLGLGLLAASLLATLLIAVAIWQSMPTMPILLFSGVLGALSGTAMAIYRWPTRRSAALEADRQLRLDDLLSTAIAISNSQGDFASAMRAMADARCGLHSPSEVIFRRFGVRSWGAIALTTCAAVTLAVIPFGPAKSQAVDANASVLSVNAGDGLASASSTPDQRIARTNDPASEGASNMSTSGDQQSDHVADDQNPRASHQSSADGNSFGSGGGISTSAPKGGTNPQTGSAGDRSSTDNGTTGGGGAAAKRGGENHDAASGTGQTSANAGKPIPAWNSVGSPREGTGAASPVNTDAVPPEHRDLVRDYFSGK